MRIAIGSLVQEANTFSPIPTTLDTFRNYYLLYGQELFTGFKDARVEVPGMLSVLRPKGVDVVPLLAGLAGASGPLTRSTFDTLLHDLIERLTKAPAVDGVLLALHGAMAAEHEPDCEGAILEAVRQVVPSRVPIGVTLDLHGLITKRMLQPNTFLIGYQEYPHIDMYETGIRAAELMLETVAGRRKPVMALAKRPMILSPIVARTTDGPLRPAVEAARAMERSGRVLHASLFPVQAWLDLPDLGFAALVCADGDTKTAQAAADELADMVWRDRDKFDPGLLPLEETIRTALSHSTGVTVVGDSGDAPTGGSAADSNFVLRGLMAGAAHQAERLTYLTMCDAEAVKACAAAGIGAEIALSVGHKVSVKDGTPFKVTGRVTTLSDGVYRMRDKGAKGMRMDNGLSAVIAIGSIRLALRSHPSYEWDTGMYHSLGLDPAEAALVFVKSPSHFRVSFGPIADRILMADTPGPTVGNVARVKLTRVARPFYPHDAAAFS